MPLINWNDSLSVNVAEIDRQHQKLVSMINELNDAMKEGKGKDVLERIVDGLVGYTETHFRTEERYFEQFGYPDAGSHKKEHSAFVQKISDFKESFQAGKLCLSVEVMNFLSDWLRNHIKGTDQEYSAFFNAKGLK